MTRRILVTGSRTWTDRAAVSRALDMCLVEAGRDLVVVHGACSRGADQLADQWVRCMWAGLPVGTLRAERHPAEWSRYGPSAGAIRNEEMVALGADLCLAFIDPCRSRECKRKRPHGSHGATHCAALAERALIPVIHPVRA